MILMTELAWLIVAGGRGSRMSAGLPKQYRPINSIPIIIHTLRAFLSYSAQSLVQIVIHPDDHELYQQSLTHLSESEQQSLLPVVSGGDTRQVSVLRGLQALRHHLKPNAIIGIHDAARPFVSSALLDRLLQNMGAADGIIPALKITDTIKAINNDHHITGSADRDHLIRVQTPQIFRFGTILKAHEAAAETHRLDLTDDAAVASLNNLKLATAEGDEQNIKITTEHDLQTAEKIMTSRCHDIRIGQGFDVHAFCPGSYVCLGGVEIPYHKSLLGHSDADVLMHAITDAIYGACADGDIGSHFPPSDPRWKGASSQIFLRHALKGVRERGGYVAHIDTTIVCEEPKIGPHRDAIRMSLSKITGLRLDQIAVKATTSEKLGFTGRKEGIAVYALATIRLPEPI
jgi:2-C-methyl-D-erythritol 4-phosphate cytidylyltransferase / 2-C-methyl-D-erythritol 2,4-cyclodiphosphate synthase